MGLWGMGVLRVGNSRQALDQIEFFAWVLTPPLAFPRYSIFLESRVLKKGRAQASGF